MTFCMMGVAFVGVHFFLPQYVDHAIEQRQQDVVGRISTGIVGDDGAVTITEDVFGSDWSVEDQIDVSELSSQGHSGDLEAQIKLARHFAQNGDENRAFQWGFRAAMQGDVLSMLETGKRYYYGRGTRKDLLRAICWYRLAGSFGEAIGTQLADNASLPLSERELKQIASQTKSLERRINRDRANDASQQGRERPVSERRG